MHTRPGNTGIGSMIHVHVLRDACGFKGCDRARIDNLSMSLPTKCRDRSFGQVPGRLSAVAVVENEVMELLSSSSSLLGARGNVTLSCSVEIQRINSPGHLLSVRITFDRIISSLGMKAEESEHRRDQ